MKCLVGKERRFVARLGITSQSTCGTKVLVCLENVTHSEQIFREHLWVERVPQMGKKGDWITFRARIRTYVSLNENNERVEKLGLTSIKKVRKL